MKLRTGFVSNSSSSSFIIAYNKEQNKCPHCGRSDTDIVKLIRECTYNDGDTEVRAEGREEVIKYIEEEWFDSAKPVIEKIKKTKDMEIALIDISYHDSILWEIIRSNKDIEVLYEDG